MNSVDFYMKEYEGRHAEADRYVRELFVLEQYTIAGTVAVYAWLLAHGDSQPPGAAWYLPLLFGVFAAFRSGAVGWQLHCLSSYLREVEPRLLVN